MHGTAARRNTIMPGKSHWRLHAASWLLLAFSGGTVLSAVLQRLLLEPEQASQRLVELNVGEMFGAAAMLSLVVAAGSSGPHSPAPTPPSCSCAPSRGSWQSRTPSTPA